MFRVSTDMSNDDMAYQLRIREFQMNQLDNQMGSQTRILNLRDDPIGAAHAVRFESKLARLDRYEKNVNSVIDSNNLADGYLKSANEVVQRVRELAIQGATGTFTAPDLKNMGQEVNQLLNELIQIANGRSADGTTLFAGERTQSFAYRTLQGNVPGAAGQVVTDVQYTGTIGENRVQTSDVGTISQNLPGNQVFWAEQQQLIANADATAYVAQNDSVISIDGKQVRISAGDNVDAVIAKINDSGAMVRASLDPVKNSLVLQTTSPHQLWLEDVGGTTFRDLGVVDSANGRPPHNLASDARLAGGSLFDMIMSLRDEMFQGSQIDVGGRGIKGIDAALSNLVAGRAEIGSRNERLQNDAGRIAFEIPAVQQQDSRVVDLDVTKAATDMKLLEYTHTAALQTAGRILPQTLLDFLR